MKTQLLEDIGHSASLTLVPSARVLDTGPHQGGQARAAGPVRPRSASGVWRQKPAGDPVLASPEPQPVPSEMPTAVAPPAPPPEAPVPPAEPRFAADPIAWGPALQDPLFELTLPLPTTPGADLFKPEPTWLERSGLRSRWGAGMLAGGLVVLAGMWFYETRTAENALALVADRSETEPQVNKAVTPRALAAKEFTLSPDGEVMVTRAVPSLAPSVLPGGSAASPSLVLLAPAPAADAEVQLTAPPPALRKERQVRPKPERVAKQTPTASLPKRVRRAEREQVVARVPVVRAARKVEVTSPRAAMLKACKAHGYQEAQCVKRACSMTKYGFVCRGK